jgi:hypothetical protein
MVNKILLAGLLLCSCNSTKTWVYVGSEMVYVQDTVVLEAIHHHYTDTSNIPHCAYVGRMEIPVTLDLERPLYKKKRVKF